MVGIKEITLDLANSMDWISRQIAPNAIRTYDRFHVERIVTEAMQQVRIKLRWEAIERERAKILFEEFPQLKKAYQLYMEFKDCYHMNRLNAETHLQSWINRAKKSKIHNMKTAAKTIEHNIGGILNYLYNKASNASVENFNRKLKAFLDYRRGVNDKNIFFYRLAQIYA